ncbi:hypothetical protein FLJC2902T_32480 [Flavobacterium limnosediminis JC2902]|uniref:Lipoprotein n=1 Tax=Flavobacterium limnosediminis JC2902 TaxID=1341181 RepID=V6S8Q6_9FLAO|nr:hypothetical protein [Flavobacterium limnosediminis]ESU22809.1 hypothetical protein FLJC2902T_32480 [Flavobacterium limnosediminis JC2902]
MNKIIFISIFFVLISCATKMKDSELYGKCKMPKYACTQLKLNKNKTFEYFVFEDVGGENLSTGTWKIHNGDTLILNSYTQPSKEEIEDEKIFGAFANPKYIVNQLIILRRNKIIFIPKNKNVKIFSLKKIELNQQKWE